ncbi:MAG: glutamyl-tRNA reductase [Acidobacteriota bacterium]|nr:glutamyl-tRNA reductase [Acidobacteriota bacterium]
MEHLHQQSILFAVGINHKTASVAIREKIFVHANEIPALLTELRKTLVEAVVLSTCNRTEIYGATTRTDLDLDFYKDLLINFKGAENYVSRKHFFASVSCAACQQLFQVATSLDSKIVGDTQILGQLRDAYAVAKRHEATGKILNQLHQRAFKIGKRARTETNLHKGAVSISLAAVELAAETFGSLEGKTVLIIGAGDTARMTAECLIQRRVGKILITNRTLTHADVLLESLKQSSTFVGETVNFAELKNHLNRADIIITSTSSPAPILEKTDFENQTNKILLIDIAVPRDIAPEAGECANVLLKNIDDLHSIVDRNSRRRAADLPLVKRIIMTEMANFLVWYYSLPLLSAALHGGAKPDKEIQSEIVRVKEFLLANVSHVHKLAMQNGAENFAGHVEVVNRLVRMKNAALSNEASN